MWSLRIPNMSRVLLQIGCRRSSRPVSEYVLSLLLLLPHDFWPLLQLSVVGQIVAPTVVAGWVAEAIAQTWGCGVADLDFELISLTHGVQAGPQGP